jgi:TPR repeat protein
MVAFAAQVVAAWFIIRPWTSSGICARAVPSIQQVLACQHSCESGSGASCLRMAKQYEAGEGVERDLTRAAEMYQEACFHGDEPSGCVSVGLMNEAGLGGEEERKKAHQYFHIACVHGDMYGCYKHAITLES